MAGASGIRAGRAFVELFADDRALVRGLRSAQQKLAAFGSAVRGLGTQMLALGAGILAPLGVAVRTFTLAGDQLDKMSARTGVSVEALGELGFAAQQSGASLEEVEKSIRTKQRTLVLASMGSAQAADAVAELGLSTEALAGLKPEQQFTAIASALQSIPDPTRRAGLAMMLLGRSGTALLPMLADLTALRAEGQRLGTWTTVQARAAAALSDAWGRLTKAKPYPLTTCIVTDEALDSMGGAITKIHEGQEVKFCCKGCIRPFDKEPAKFIKKMNKEAAKPAAAKTPAKAGGGHTH